MQLTSVSGVFLAVGCVPGSRGEERIANISNDVSLALNQFISIGQNSRVTLFNHRPEMGQGTFQSIPMILAEELEVDINNVIIKQSEADQEKYGWQMVVGSHSIQNEFEKLRKMGAAAKEILLQAAADQWGTTISDCVAKNGVVTCSSSGKSLSYGELVEAASKLKAPEEPKLKDPENFSVIGQSVPRQDIPLKTNGKAIYGIDISVPGMLHASIERSPVFLGEVLDFNEKEVLAVPGVKHVFKTQRNVFGRNREGVAVLAESYWAAEQGRKALKVRWNNGDLESNTSASIMEEFRKASNGKGDELFSRGNAYEVFSKSQEVMEASYEAPYQSHVPMEPMNAIVSVKNNSAEFWGSTQNPNGIRSYLAKQLEIPEENVKINYTFMGGGFGRRSLTDVAEEAADLSKKAGVPVKVTWTREDDQTQGPFRACSLNVMRGVLKNGKVVALEHKVVSQEIRNQTGENMTAGRQLMGGINTEYAITNLAVRGVLRKLYVPISYWRAVYHSTNPFAHESFIDELAVKAGKDPLDFRLEMMKDHARFRKVLEVVAEKTNWYGTKKPNTGRGVAICERSGAHFAMVVEVERKDGRVKPTKITTALDLGICVNPDTVKAQTEGSVVMGLTAAYYGLTIEKGRIAEQNFDTYPLLRIGECPEIVTHIIQSTADPDGAGESGLPTVAPALVNAIFDLTGRRIRKLPVDLRKIS